MGEKISSFRGKYGFLSNMATAVFEWDGRTYRNSEAAFQSAKSLDPAERDLFSSMAGVVAKRTGKKVRLRNDWMDVKVGIMREIVRAKFMQNPDLLQKLLDTGDAELIEGNSWHDTFWGVDQATGEGENHLGRILMQVRAELGGSEYLEKAQHLKEQREMEAREKEAETAAALNAIQKELDALPVFSYEGMEMNTKAFGRIRIKRHEGEYLIFDTASGEKVFALPNCILQGFLIPDDPRILETLKRRDALQKQRKELQHS